jgi:ubiquinone/menaquinone biosynthesis C-methylase UbiE
MYNRRQEKNFMERSRGEEDFVKLPHFAARLYDSMMQNKATRQQYKEIALDLVSRFEAGRLLDIGTGPGYLLREIHNLNPDIELYGLDISAAMVDQARRNLVEIQAELRQGSIEATEYESGFFDLITCSGSFYLWDHPQAGLEEIFRLLKKGQSAFLFETHREIDEKLVRKKMRENLRGENLVRRWLSPRFLEKQLRMTYSKEEIIRILGETQFAGRFMINEVIIAGLPVWLRIQLEKPV